MAFNLNGLNFNQSILDSSGRVIKTDADLVNRATLGLQAMHSPNVHHFPLILAAGEPIPVSSQLAPNSAIEI
jgi:photosystem II P680 reaction center D1 protein